MSFTGHCGNTGVERTPKNYQHTKLTLEKKFFRRCLPEFELATFRSRVRCSYQQAVPAPVITPGENEWYWCLNFCCWLQYQEYTVALVLGILLVLITPGMYGWHRCLGFCCWSQCQGYAGGTVLGILLLVRAQGIYGWQCPWNSATGYNTREKWMVLVLGILLLVTIQGMYEWHPWNSAGG